MNKKAIVILGIGISTVVILLVIFIISLFVDQNKNTPTILPTITPAGIDTTPLPNAPKSTLLIPTAPSGGVDLNSPTVETSTTEIRKIAPLLPHTFQQRLSTGITVDIFISDVNISARPWVLPIFIGGIDYRVPVNSPEYVTMRTSFREAAESALSWLSQNDVNTSLIFINWGDQTFIQERAEEWLK